MESEFLFCPVTNARYHREEASVGIVTQQHALDQSKKIVDDGKQKYEVSVKKQERKKPLNKQRKKKRVNKEKKERKKKGAPGTLFAFVASGAVHVM